ncbi:hypothetical protein CYMTET_52802 [Cymbomonas tetramitiformis]|uniref:Uncharacterized protein n=1 Tax=Cymbomonas tetramitiformis TaxID=36881 RepID=A0AAE0BJL2_9CHLO|nr:hypothetical protein CYMTET_52802 [Cymbomonas tetramitiformis]
MQKDTEEEDMLSHLLTENDYDDEVDLIKGCVPPAVRQKLQAEHSSLTYPANVDPRPILAKEQRLVRENPAADWTRTATTRKQQLWESLDPNFYAAIRDDLILKLFAKIERIENFVKSQRQGAVLNDGASAGGVDISAYGFATGDSEDSDGEGMDVETEQQQQRSEVAAATGVSMMQASFAPPLSAVVAATTANDAPNFTYSAPSDEFTGGIEEVPPPAGPRTIEMGAHCMGTLSGDAVEQSREILCHHGDLALTCRLCSLRAL